MIRRSTWIVLIIFLILLGAMLVTQNFSDEPEELDVTTTELDVLEPLEFAFDFQDGEAISGLIVEDATGNVVEIQQEPNADNWIIITPEGIADHDTIDQVISQIGNIQIETSLDEEIDLGAIGLSPPAFTITITLNTGKQLLAYIGDVTITKSSYYAQLNGKTPQVIGKFQVDSIVDLLANPPIMKNPTPASELTEESEN